ncbi:MAG: amidohydrolase family protein [bacterium]|nr:amidohydrolase family protein [bacterium]
MKKWIAAVGLLLAVGIALFVLAKRSPGEGGGWGNKVRAALEKTECISAPEKRYGNLRYDGPLIDTHYHIPHFDDPPPWERNNGRPYMGDNITIGDIACTIQQEHTRKVFAFFPVFPGEHSQEFLDLVYGAMKQYPDVFVPFIMPPDRDNNPGGFPTVSADVFQDLLGVYPGLFRGYGEIGLYARGDRGGPKGAAALPPDSQRLTDMYPVVRKHDLAVYFHLGEGQQESFERAVAQNPDINFIWHGDQLIPYEGGRQNLQHIEEIISRHPNVFYTIDELYGDDFLIKPEVTKEQFLAHLGKYAVLLEEDVATWKGIIERHPDQFLWGTDRSPQVLWSHDPEVGQALTGYTRAFIARLNPAVQEKFAYKNAEHLLPHKQK